MNNQHTIKGGQYFLNNMQKKLNNKGLIVVKVGNDCVIISKKILLKELTIHKNTLKQLKSLENGDVEFDKNNEILKHETIRVLKEADNKEEWNNYPDAYKNICNKYLDSIIP